MAEKAGTDMVQWVNDRLTYGIQIVIALFELVVAFPFFFFSVLAVHVVASIMFVLTVAGIFLQWRQDRKNEQRIAALEYELSPDKLLGAFAETPSNLS